MRNRWISGVLWSAAAIVAVGAGTAAVSAASTGTGRDVLSQQDVARQLAAQRDVVPAASVAPAGTSTDGTASQSLSTVGGTVVVRCAGGIVTLLRWSPRTGFRADDGVARGPAAAVRVIFESDTADDVAVSVTCVAGVAESTVSTEPDDHGGHDGNGGGNSGPGNGNPAPTPSAGGDDHGGNGGGNDDPAGHQ